MNDILKKAGYKESSKDGLTTLKKGDHSVVIAANGTRTFSIADKEVAVVGYQEPASQELVDTFAKA